MLERILYSDAFEGYRYMQYRLFTLHDFVKEADDGTTCPACPVILFNLATLPHIVSIYFIFIALSFFTCKTNIEKA